VKPVCYDAWGQLRIRTFDVVRKTNVSQSRASTYIVSYRIVSFFQMIQK
jgi:hypothetical protein